MPARGVLKGPLNRRINRDKRATADGSERSLRHIPAFDPKLWNVGTPASALVSVCRNAGAESRVCRAPHSPRSNRARWQRIRASGAASRALTGRGADRCCRERCQWSQGEVLVTDSSGQGCLPEAEEQAERVPLDGRSG